MPEKPRDDCRVETLRASVAKGFTLVELLVSIAIIAILAGFLYGGLYRSIELAHASVCLSNQRQIGMGLQMYVSDYDQFPENSDTEPLRQTLSQYIPDGAVFKCPKDKDPNSIDSYEPFYVARSDPDGESLYTLGCPRHQSNVSLFSNNSATFSSLGQVYADGKSMNLGGSEEERSIKTGVLDFADGSQLTVTLHPNGFKLTVLESFRLSDGTLYTVVRMTGGNGGIDVQVTPGSKFEVVTPSAIIAVEGTQFSIKILGNGSQTKVDVSSGKVRVHGRGKHRGRLKKLTAGKSALMPPTL